MLRRVQLAVILVVLTAGCGGVADSAGTGDRDAFDVEQTVRPSGPTAGDLPPGLSFDGIDDERALMSGHWDRVDGDAFSIATVVTATDENGTVVYTREQVFQSDPGVPRYYLRDNRSGQLPTGTPGVAGIPVDGPRRIEYWVNGSRSLERLERDGNATYQRDASPRVRTGHRLLASAVLSVGSESVEQRSLDGETHLLVEGTQPPAGSPFEADNFSSRVIVSEDGLIRLVELRGTVVVDGERIRITRRVVVYDVGETTPERPEWYDEAMNATSASANAAAADADFRL